jgi:hypothetical protein
MAEDVRGLLLVGLDAAHEVRLALRVSRATVDKEGPTGHADMEEEQLVEGVEGGVAGNTRLQAHHGHGGDQAAQRLRKDRSHRGASTRSPGLPRCLADSCTISHTSLNWSREKVGGTHRRRRPRPRAAGQ